MSMPAMPNAYALVIGIANYQHIHKLPPTVLKDAQDIYELLIDPQHCGYPAENVRLLLDGQATQAAIRRALAELAVRGDADSTAFFYISGHGGRIESGPNAGEYLLPVGADVEKDADGRVKLDKDGKPILVVNTAISSAELAEALEAIKARKTVVIFDCCHSAGLTKGVGDVVDVEALGIKSGFSDDYYAKLAVGRGRAILASSRNTEYSYVLPGAENSLFTQHLLAGLCGGIPSDDGLIRIFDLFEYLQPKVTADQPKQHPIFKAKLEENFPVALYLGGQKGVVPKVEGDFRYDAYISYVDKDPDTTWVWDTLVPHLEDANLRVAVSGDVEAPGAARVVNIERGIRQAKRTVIVLSEAYLADHMADFENVLAQTMGIQEGAYRLLPVKIEAVEEGRLPTRLSMLTTLDLAHPRRAGREFERLVRALQGRLPLR
jgi:hypothetical protein